MTRRRYRNSFHDNEKSPSFDFQKEGEVVGRVLSPALFRNEMISSFLLQVEKLVVDLINNVSRIKRHLIYSVDPKDQNIE